MQELMFLKSLPYLVSFIHVSVNIMLGSLHRFGRGLFFMVDRWVGVSLFFDKLGLVLIVSALNHDPAYWFRRHELWFFSCGFALSKRIRVGLGFAIAKAIRYLLLWMIIRNMWVT